MAKKLISKTPWRMKLEKPMERKLVDMPECMSKRFGPGTMLIPTPLDIDAAVRKVEKGKLVTLGQIRQFVAGQHEAGTTCPMCAGMFLRFAAEAAEEDRMDGKEDVTPYWRVLKDDGSLNPKLPGGVEEQARHLEAEGHVIKPGKGKKPPVVEKFEERLAELQ